MNAGSFLPAEPRAIDWQRIEVVDEAVAVALRKLAGAERLRLAHEAWELARDRLTLYLTWRHPEWSRAEVARQVARRLAA
jgi:hypothetical protein